MGHLWLFDPSLWTAYLQVGGPSVVALDDAQLVGAAVLLARYSAPCPSPDHEKVSCWILKLNLNTTVDLFWGS